MFEVQFITKTGALHSMRVKAETKTEAKEHVKKLAAKLYGDVTVKKAVVV